MNQVAAEEACGAGNELYLEDTVRRERVEIWAIGFMAFFVPHASTHLAGSVVEVHSADVVVRFKF